ncbi:MAG: CBS domain-containing protein [Actinomycetota bacterium]|nr:CBS domain-containing protein [Actinomycetota bacterium]MDA2971593.1 CBS domain-containing protein [Actinomycetota bacterium]MDA3000283.1 CBS domain-containing protein [Actinomycetota bacterium]
MAGELIYAFRIMRLPLLDAGGASIGRVDDVVVVPGRAGSAPRVVGFTATSQRRRIFVNAGKVGQIADDGVRLRSWDIDLNPFKIKKGERLLGRDVIDRRVNGETVSDVALRERLDSKSGGWEVAQVRLAKRTALRRRPTHRLVEWVEVASLFAAVTEMAAEAARLHDMHPTDVAAVVRSLPIAQRRQLAEAMDDDRLADVLEELPESEQVGLIEGLDMDRLLAVLDEMESDDLADLLAEMPGEQRARILDAMDDEDAEQMRRLLSYEEGTAGGLMTPEIIILGPTSTVAEALAEIRDPEWLVSIASQVFVCRPPYKSPTGRYLGVVHFQRLLREAPSMELGQCLETEPTITPDISDREVAERLASYNMLSIGVCDEAGRLLGAITIDDVLDRTLPTGWRQRRRHQATSVTT